MWGLELGEIIQESWGVYKRKFLTLVIPFFVVAITASVVFSLIDPAEVKSYGENRTTVIAGGNLSSPSLLDVDDENYFETMPDENQELEFLHDSQVIHRVEIKDKWIMISLNFSSSGLMTYYFDIYDFSDDSWENGTFGKVDTKEVTWSILRTDDVENYLGDGDFIKIRLRAENTEVTCREDYLVYEVIRPPEFAKTLMGYLTLFLSLTFCFGMVICTTQGEVLKKRVKLRDIFRVAAEHFPIMLITALMVVLPLVSIWYLAFSYPWGIFMILPVPPLLFFCTYAWQGVVIRSLLPWSSVRSSIRVAWENLGTTAILYLPLVLVWFFLGPIPIIGILIFWLFLPLWVVALTVTYMDRTGELLRIKSSGD